MATEFHFDPSKATLLREKLVSLVLRTPLVPSKSHPSLSFKAENLQVTGSFKARPALSQVLELTDEEKEKGIVTSSSGNFAQGVAYAASHVGVTAKIVMMRSSNPLKISGTRQLGGEVVLCDDRFEARQETVDKIRAEEGRVEIFPYDHPLAILGNASIGAEILEDQPETQRVVVPISGGGLISGIAAMIKSVSPQVQVWGVQPSGSNATALSFKLGERKRIERAETIADGLMVTSPGKITFPVIQKYVDDVVEVAEDDIRKAVRHLFLQEKLVVEPSGAVGMAAVLAGRIPVDSTVLVLSGGNIGPDRAVEFLS